MRIFRFSENDNEYLYSARTEGLSGTVDEGNSVFVRVLLILLSVFPSKKDRDVIERKMRNRPMAQDFLLHVRNRKTILFQHRV